MALAWRGEGGISLPAGAESDKRYDRLLPGERDEIVVEFLAPAEFGPKTRINASTREERGWAAAGATVGFSR